MERRSFIKTLVAGCTAVMLDAKAASPEVPAVIAQQMLLHPNALWFKSRALIADIPNCNGDIFPAEEIRKSYKTFEGKPFAWSGEYAPGGQIVLAEWNEEEKCVYCTGYLEVPTDEEGKAKDTIRRCVSVSTGEDEMIFTPESRTQRLIDQIKTGELNAVGMGCSITHCQCCICKKTYTSFSDECEHAKANGRRESKTDRLNVQKSFGLGFLGLKPLRKNGATRGCDIIWFKQNASLFA